MEDEVTHYPETSHPYMQGDTHSATLRVLSGGLTGKKYPLSTRDFLVGRGRGADIIINENLVSRRHAIIKKKINEYMICDLHSTNGIFINNLKMEKAILNNGDLIQIGSCVFQFTWNRAGEENL